jgi:hypothetical protein
LRCSWLRDYSYRNEILRRLAGREAFPHVARKIVDSEIQFDDERNSGYVIFSSMHEGWGGVWLVRSEKFAGKKVDE